MHKSNIFHNAQEKHCLVYMSQVFGKRISNSSAGPTNESLRDGGISHPFGWDIQQSGVSHPDFSSIERCGVSSCIPAEHSVSNIDA